MKTIQRWSTDNIAADRRLRFWRDAVHESLVEMDLRPTDKNPGFMSAIEACQVGCIAPHQAQGSAQRVTRGKAEIARGQKNAYYLLSQPRKSWRIKHAGLDFMMHPGESVLVDSREPYEFLFGEGLDDLSVEMPIDWLERWVPSPGALIGRPLQCSSGWGKALSSFKEALIPKGLVSLSMPDTLLEEQFGLLLSLASEPIEATPSASNPLLQNCLSVMRQRFSDSALVAQAVAADCAVSVRSLHRAFAVVNKTFGGVLMEMRLAQATRMLSSRRFSGITIAEIARRCGFLDPSHFARQFKSQHNMSPHEFRKASS
jgi:AraC family transcriptional regulator, positive regulator of tynA and feaB